MSLAGRIFSLSNGAFDPTVGPLVDLWGFGRKQAPDRIPDAKEIQDVLQNVGFGNIRRESPNILIKEKPGLTVDLAAIAKGYAVDRVSALMRETGDFGFLVEVGGEVFAKGKKAHDAPWRVGINRPDPAAGVAAVYKALPLIDEALATSGSYRNFIELNGKAFSHILDPTTGRPAQNRMKSASVKAPDCALADGLATALMVMGPEKGMEMINGLKDVECFLVEEKPGKGFVDHASAGFFQ